MKDVNILTGNKMITLRINSQAHLSPRSEIPGQVAVQIRDRLTFPNPGHQEAEKRGKGRYGVATAYETILTSLDAPLLGAINNG